jgi:GTP-binding protein
VEPGVEVYEGMIIGENARSEDMDVNPTKERKVTNMRSATSEELERLIPARLMSLEQALEFCREDECIEVTPTGVRMRKVILDQNERVRNQRKVAKN